MIASILLPTLLLTITTTYFYFIFWHSPFVTIPSSPLADRKEKCWITFPQLLTCYQTRCSHVQYLYLCLLLLIVAHIIGNWSLLVASIWDYSLPNEERRERENKKREERIYNKQTTTSISILNTATTTNTITTTSATCFSS